MLGQELQRKGAHRRGAIGTVGEKAITIRPLEVCHSLSRLLMRI